ncbi:LAGLIDADG family homing endonuclease [Sulfuricaulis sp.]|uniref:LAGLIDADG family homing endonuclease n=1 Tax=Sulfuricaulis sp. TaxID=2003553 RepID=UPI0034A2FE38
MDGAPTDLRTEISIQPASLDIWDKKYRLKSKTGEALDQDITGTYARVARALADVEEIPEKREEWFEKFFWALQNGAIPAGRIISNAGALEHKPATSTINCTVSRAVPDSMDGILSSVHEAGLTLKAGCVAPGTWVVTERGLVTADRAVAERHAQILCYDRDAGRFEMQTILRHLTTLVPRAENIEIVSNGASLKTSIKHPVLVYRHGKLIYTRADDVRTDDALVHHHFAWSAEPARALEAWFAGAHLGDGSAYPKAMAYKPSRQAWAARAQAYGKRLVFKIRAAEREVVERYAAFFQSFCGAQAKVVATATANGTPVWDYTVASFEATNAAGLIDHQIGAKSDTLRVPAWIKTNPEKYLLPFLAGLIDTDGTVSRETGSAGIAMQNPDFAEELKSLLALFGIHGAITLRTPRPHVYNGHVVNDHGGAMLKISDSEFLAKVAEHMADSGKRGRILKCATQSGQYDTYVLPQTLHEALEQELPGLGHVERQKLGFYHGYHRARAVSRIWLDRWEARFPNLRPLIGLARTLRPVEAIQRNLDLPETFYDFTVEKHNNYLAGNNGLVTIHNCGIGYEFSTLRPKGAFVSGAGAYTSGPLSFMDIFDAMCFTVSSAGGRRGAQMGTFDIAHPDIMDFIRAKREDGRLRQFNLSCLITDEFMQAVKMNTTWDLLFPVNRHEYEDPESHIVWRYWPVTEGYITNNLGQVACKVYKSLPARRLWDLIMASTYDYAEPGFILIDKINEMNNNWFCENIRATNPCVTADTRLHTQYGLVPIGELYAAGVPLQATVDVRALGQDGRCTTVRPAVPAFMTAQEADVYRVQTADGYEIKATAWHDFYTQRGKIKLKDLRPGDELLVQSGKGQFGKEGNAELGALIGLIAGDGHFTNRGKGKQAAIVNFWNEDRALAPVVAGYINTLIAGLAVRPRAYRVEPVAVPDRHHVFLRSVLLARFLEHYGFTASTKYKVPGVIWRGTEDCVKGYLRGLFQTDGTVNATESNSCCTIRLASSHPDLLKEVQTLLANFGIFCRIHKRREAAQRSMPDGKGGNKLYHCCADYELIIGSESRERFMREIGFLGETKNNRYRVWAQDRALQRMDSFTAKITEISYIGKEAVFDTTQSDHNTLVFNGLVTGNCGEQPLPQYGSCLLGSVNLTKFVEEPFTDAARFNWEQYREVVAVFTRMLDNVVEINGLPLEPQRHEIHYKRRHGMGFLGLGSTLTMLKMKYGSPESLEFTERVAREMAEVGWRVGIELAEEKGPAPIMEDEFTVTEELLVKRPEMRQHGYKVGDSIKGKVLLARYSRYMQQFDASLTSRIAEKGARFTHHTSIAPTGTISLSLANNASNGIEPSFAHKYSRNVLREGKKSKEKVEVFSYELLAYRSLVNPDADPDAEGGSNRLPDYFITADHTKPREHVDVQAAAQKWVDSSISKTANVPTDFPYEDFKDIYLYAYEQGLKGCTTFRFNPQAFQGVLVKDKDLENTTYRFQLESGEVIEVKGNEEIEYDGEVHNAANLYDALKEGYYGRF